MDTVKLNSRGPDVALLQAILNRLGFNTGTVDGIFGTRTQNGVLRFQRSAGLSPDGVVGARTWAALEPYLMGYQTYLIRPGDTFFDLAQRFNTSVAAIETANPNLNPNQLQIGQRVIIPLRDPVVLTNIPYTSQTLRRNIEGLTKRYPFLRTGVVGRSGNGQQIPYLMFGNGPIKVGYNAAHHANEWITTPILMKFTEQMCRAYAFGLSLADSDVRRLWERTTFVIVPMVNPDGVDLVTGEYAPGSREYNEALALNTDLPFPDGWKANLAGTDLNLNYPAGWEEARRIKFEQGYTRPGPRDYVGPSPLSAPESRAMANFTEQQDFRLILAYHTQGELIFWKYLDYQPKNSLEIARRFSEVSGYAVEETPYASGFAGYKDWFIQTRNRPGYTIECGRGVNPLPISQFNEIYRDNLGILLLGGELAE
ncbi:MAG: peptidoglycan-binding protein [Clostridia bacterium]|nr:peptidoglycan-binding protein [Clostridia bacterium]